MKGLYVHIPFCSRVCAYCDFTKRVPKDKNQIDEYLSFLIKEYKTLNQKFDTIYIGGGTPSMLSSDQLEKLLKEFDTNDLLEFTFECNIESIDEAKLKILKKYNVSRISFGVQTFNDRLIKIISRNHNSDMVFEKIKLTKKYFDNINIDLMFSIPSQTLDDVKADLLNFIKLDINHISYYSLILEEKTPLYIKYLQDKIKLNSIEEERIQYEYIIDFLEKNGFHQYEISNFCKNNESIHNKLYWEYESWIGIGLNAASKIDNRRFSNSFRFNEYYENKKNEDIILSNLDLLKENIIMSLRLIKGFNILDLNKKYNVDILNLFDISDLLNNGFLIIENNYLHLTKKGLFVANDIFERFL